MKRKDRSVIQIIMTAAVIAICFAYMLYINDRLNFKLFSIGDINPYGGWSALKSKVTDVSYRWQGFHKSIALTISITITAFFMGRFFCGYICPIGALQDFIKFLGKKIGIREVKLLHRRYIPFEALKYFIFIIGMILSILGLGKYISVLSPWTSYVNLFIGNLIFPGVLILGLIIVCSLFIKRIFCRFICPLGAFQGLLYAFGPSKIKKNRECAGCNRCFQSCPVEIKRTEDFILSPECINCLNCIGNGCVKDRDGYGIYFAKRRLSRQQYVIISFVLFLGIFLVIPMIPTAKTVQSRAVLENIKDGSYLGEGIGFGGEVKVKVHVKENRLNEITILDHSETSGYYQEAFKSIRKEIVERQGLNIDAISGATASSRGLLNAVKDAVGKALIE